MSFRFSRRLFLLQLLLLTACGVKLTSSQGGELIVGVISYGEGEQMLNRFERFNRYLSEKTGLLIKLEPAFNENVALERIENGSWSLIFAPPGLAAIAIDRYQYVPVFPLQGVGNTSSILVVRKDSPIRDLKELEGQTVVLGKPGSATGYYLPLYNLYGLTVAEILFAPTPQIVLEWVGQRKATAGALSREEFNLYSPQFSNTEFRILFSDLHNVPPGAVLIGSTVERNREKYIRKFMNEAPAVLAQEVGYVPNEPVPEYQYMISVVERVRSIANHLSEKPARLF